MGFFIFCTGTNKTGNENLFCFIILIVLYLYSLFTINKFKMRRKTLKHGTLEFSVDYEMECEDFELTDVKDRDITENVDDKWVTNYIHCLSERIKEFYPSQHRTEGTIHLCGDYMLMKYRSFKSPDWDNFEDIDLGVVDMVPFVYTT